MHQRWPSWRWVSWGREHTKSWPPPPGDGGGGQRGALTDRCGDQLVGVRSISMVLPEPAVNGLMKSFSWPQPCSLSSEYSPFSLPPLVMSNGEAVRSVVDGFTVRHSAPPPIGKPNALTSFRKVMNVACA